ncbi:UDP-N-acetylmuramoyl-tripeptide--D-alanyl-D-alanine ligase [Galbibacter mesophilus]|uniref:UDP-N-acetylmuramoyl-tripeptide--D-alanyl-D- alanine ligase n=1 Tax=Galbibacter mesophilus TaxID=379069 RepID=UPI00191CB5C6|nr:UDP-N-acetylmuramoyl-tripeptide--D-alanyl-D-alanine ligase [Galbibacter mesophilus]MCM5664353.1 UDP-N-acetylmuramoyl-tripeptide--D-alanyl-D-alanine ligase [Galbibacter mesophilus]
MKTAAIHSIFLETTGAVTDTRKIEKDSIFFSLKGANFNGNEFAEQALKKGAKYAVVDEAKFNTSENIILVDDCLKALQKLAKFHREYLKLPIVSLTGSNGKTTTKELINAVLSKKFRTVATQGNLNNHIGVPLTLLSMNKTTEIGIVEMGANHQKEIEGLCNIALPDYGFITNFGKAHLEGFGGVEGVIKGKSELYTHLIKHQKTIFYNADDKIQAEKLHGYKNKIGFSTKNESNLKIEQKDSNSYVSIYYGNKAINSNLIGDYNFTNIAAAILIGKHFEVPDEDTKEAIEAYTPSNNRSQIIKKEDRTIILDAYNANPSSMEAALNNFKRLQSNSKLVILGDMFELGVDAEIEHQYIADLVAEMNFDNAVLVGENFFKTKSTLIKFKNFNDLQTYLKKEQPKEQNILIKGSRGMALERALDLLK